jgi:NitT/TauT family transport system substrate-binding protein
MCGVAWRMNRRDVIRGCGALLAVPVAASAQAEAPIRIGVGGADTFAEGFYATDLGIFQKAGLNVEMTIFNQGAAIATAVAANALDVGISNTVNLALAIAHGAPFRIIAGAGMYSSDAPTTVLMVQKNSALQHPKDLEGKTIAVTALKDLTEVGVRAWLERNGVDAGKIKFTEIPMVQMPPNLTRGTVDAAVVGEPWLSTSQAILRTFATFYDAVAPRFLIANWFSTADYVQKNGAQLRRLVDSVYETARWANAHHAESAAILAKWAKLDPATIALMGRCAYATSLDPRYLDPVFAAMYKYDAIDRKLTVGEVVAK